MLHQLTILAERLRYSSAARTAPRERQRTWCTANTAGAGLVVCVAAAEALRRECRKRHSARQGQLPVVHLGSGDAGGARRAGLLAARLRPCAHPRDVHLHMAVGGGVAQRRKELRQTPAETAVVLRAHQHLDSAEAVLRVERSCIACAKTQRGSRESDRAQPSEGRIHREMRASGHWREFLLGHRQPSVSGPGSINSLRTPPAPQT